MFRISYLVTDDDLVKTIRMITPLAIDLNVSSAPNGETTLPTALPAPSKSRTGLQSLDRLLHSLGQRNLKTFKISMFREVTKEAGLNPVSSDYYLRQLVKYGCLSKLGKGMHVSYQVLGPKT